jgi:hypothetical protein
MTTIIRRLRPLALLLGLGPLAACSDDGSGSSGGGGEAGTSGPSSSSATATGSSSADASASASSTSTGAGGEGPACESGLEQETEACTACQDASCCVSATQAAEDPGIWTESSATICREANCWEECDVPQPECGGIQPTPVSCTDDLYETCCELVEACAKSDACTALIYICIDDRECAPFSTCFDDCSTELGLEDGIPIFEEFAVCFEKVVCD